jgi:hypothetical protein
LPAQKVLAQAIRDQLGLEVESPARGQSFDLI